MASTPVYTYTIYNVASGGGRGVCALGCQRSGAREKGSRFGGVDFWKATPKAADEWRFWFLYTYIYYIFIREFFFSCVILMYIIFTLYINIYTWRNWPWYFPTSSQTKHQSDDPRLCLYKYNVYILCIINPV